MPADQEGPQPVARQARRLERARQHQQIEAQHHGHAEEAQLLGQHREDEVGVARRQVAELALGALAVALAHEAARAHGDLRLDLLVARALGVQRRIEEGVDARLLVVPQGVAPAERRRRQPAPETGRAPPAAAGRPETRPPGTSAPGRRPCRGRARPRSAAPAGPPRRPGRGCRAGPGSPSAYSEKIFATKMAATELDELRGLHLEPPSKNQRRVPAIAGRRTARSEASTRRR